MKRRERGGVALHRWRKWALVGCFLATSWQFVFITSWYSKQTTTFDPLHYDFGNNFPANETAHGISMKNHTQQLGVKENLTIHEEMNILAKKANVQVDANTNVNTEVDLHRNSSSNTGDILGSNSSTFSSNVFTETTEKRYLIYCDKLEGFLLPIMKHFTLVRLLDSNTKYPPWNATAFLVMDDKNCGEHPYVKESQKRRKEAAYIDASNHTEMNGKWNNGIYWPFYCGQKFMHSIQNRPAMMNVRSEVFWRASYDSGHDVDFVWDRHRENPSNESFVIHYVQGAWASYHNEQQSGLTKDDIGSEAANAIFEGRLAHPAKPKKDEALSYNKFCSFLIRSDPNNLVQMFITKNYDIEAITRHMFFKQLSLYKPCHRIKKCKGNPYDSYKCFAGSKFHITMENSQLNGYVSEKVFNGGLGGGVPIYFGAPDIGLYINEKSIVHCNINRTIIKEMQLYYPRVKKPRPFLFNRSSFKTDMYPTEQELLSWADGYLHKELEPCVQRVVELDNNDTAFREVLREPLITNPEIVNGMYPLRGIIDVYEALRTWSTF